jgi:protocatechuate 4,5-dioxygenase beta chain
MAQIVSVIASTHNPRICWNRDQANKDDLAYLFQSFGELRTRLARAKPDVIVAVANDHLDNFFFDNMPAFTVCTGPMAEGPFWYEAEIMHLPAYKARIDQDFAGYLLRRGIERGMAFSQSYEFRFDHAFTLPLSFLRPEEDLPLVPIVSNAFGYPIPANTQWYELGRFLREAIGAWPDDVRVAVVASFNMTVDVGGPKMGNYNNAFNAWLLDRMRAGHRDEILANLTVPRLIEEGNSTAEFLNYVTVLGVVEDRPPSFIEHKPVRGVGTCPLAIWDFD